MRLAALWVSDSVTFLLRLALPVRRWPQDRRFAAAGFCARPTLAAWENLNAASGGASTARVITLKSASAPASRAKNAARGRGKLPNHLPASWRGSMTLRKCGKRRERQHHRAGYRAGSLSLEAFCMLSMLKSTRRRPIASNRPNFQTRNVAPKIAIVAAMRANDGSFVRRGMATSVPRRVILAGAAEASQPNVEYRTAANAAAEIKRDSRSGGNCTPPVRLRKLRGRR